MSPSRSVAGYVEGADYNLTPAAAVTGERRGPGRVGDDTARGLKPLDTGAIFR